MKKIVFKGTVNGKEFNDVKSYNDALQKAIALGEMINAQSHTETVNTTNELPQKPEEDICMLPGFENFDEYYIDKLVTGDREQDKAAYKKWEEELSDTFAKVLDKVFLMDLEEIKSYSEELEDALQCIEEDKNDNNKVIKELEGELARYRGAYNIIDLTKRYYNFMLDQVKIRQGEMSIAKLDDCKHELPCRYSEDKCDCDCGCKCNCECDCGCKCNCECDCGGANCTCREKEPQKEYDPFKELYKMIFG
jgi:uncharacterized linocin/CFP29 family protein